MAGEARIEQRRKFRCYTRAWKNAQYLQQIAPGTFAKDKKAAGFGTGVPLDILNRLQHLRPDSPELKGYRAVSEFLRHHRVPGPERWQR
jgi:hypothetical protein